MRADGHIERTILGSGIVAVLLVVTGSLTLAQNSPSGGAGSSATGCVDRDSGALRMVKSGKRCRRGERRLTWSRRGREGSAGVAGADGRAGPAGAQGLPGETGDRGQPGSFSFDNFDGMPCNDGQDGNIQVTYDANGVASLTC